VAAVEILYGADVRGADAGELLDDRDDADAYCRHLVESVDRQRARLDELIGAHAHNWTTERMSPVDRNVLRVGALELCEGDVPAAAVIDEAVEIAKRFSGEEAGRFVNGVLEALRQELGAEGGGSPASESPSSGGFSGSVNGAGGS
jgi:transcription antitermination protein NusB